MAKSRKSSKATDKKKNIVESSEESEIVTSDELTELATIDEGAAAEKHEEVVAAEQDDPAVVAQSEKVKAEEAVDSLAEEIEENQTESDPEAVAKAELELEDAVLAEDQADLAALDGQAPEAIAEESASQDAEALSDADPQDDENEGTESVKHEDLEKAEETPEAEILEESARETASESAVETPEKETAAAIAAPAPPAQQSGGSIWPAFFGGVIAALFGFIVGRGDVIDRFLPESFQRAAIDTSVIETLTEQTQVLAAQSETIVAQSETLSAQTTSLADSAAAQTARIDALEATVSAVPSVAPEEVAALAAQLDDMSDRLTELEARQTTLEPSDDVASTDEVAALESTLADQKAQLAELAARAEAAEARAADEAAQLLARAAMARLETAVDSGETFAPALSDLEEVAPVEVPDALREAAEAGVPTLAALQDSFPDAARAGLSAARAEVPESEVVGVTGFIRRQLNVRSVTPREGSDPDAVLSRAQAAVRAGDLDTALTEMEALPDAARTAMSDWLDAASARKAAQDAASELSDSLNSN